MSAHCSPCAPGGVSQRTCQSPCTDFTVPCAAAVPTSMPAIKADAATAVSPRRAGRDSHYQRIAAMIFPRGALAAARDPLTAESPLPDGTLRSLAYMVRQPCQERGDAASSPGNMGAISVPSASRPISLGEAKQTPMRRIAGAAELWFEKA